MITNQHEKRRYSVGIVGLGFVGRAINHLFPDAKTYDVKSELGNNDQSAINSCEIVFISVPTHGNTDGSVDLSAVVDVLHWLDGPIPVIKSTVPADATDYLSSQSTRPIVFNPEFLTEKNWQKDIENETRIILGSTNKEASKNVARAYQKVCSQEMSYHYTDPKTAVLTKYVGNAFLAMKVTFANQIYDICQASSVDYDELRELWLLDPRVGRSHTIVTEQRGFGGYCLPKDLSGLITTAKKANVEVPLLKSAEEYNNKLRQDEK